MLQGFVELPADAQVAITALVTAVIAFALEWLIKSVPWLAFLKAYAAEWGLALSAVLLDVIQNALPTGYEDVAIKGVLFVLALIGAFVKFAKARGVKAFS